MSDASNYDIKYRRNYYCHKILPALDALFPDVPYKENIARLAQKTQHGKARSCGNSWTISGGIS
ncbi:hypothetical protein J6Y50_05955 [bacterium]|nr:hypothetical protein [bacterium]